MDQTLTLRTAATVAAISLLIGIVYWFMVPKDDTVDLKGLGDLFAKGRKSPAGSWRWRLRRWRRATARVRGLVGAGIAGTVLFGYILTTMDDSTERTIVDHIQLAPLRLYRLMMDDSTGRTVVGRPQVRDGDSLTINGTEIRLWGVDAPELRQRGGMQARDALRRKIGLSSVRCQEAGDGQDRYGRVLARCTISDGTELNHWLVQNGLAHAYTRYTSRYTIRICCFLQYLSHPAQ